MRRRITAHARPDSLGHAAAHFNMDSDAFIAWALAAAFLSGSIEIAGLVDRGAALFGRRWRWLPPLARRVCKAFGGRTRPRQVAIARFLLADEGFKNACQKHALQVKRWLAAPAAMSPVSAAAAWAAPSICTSGELAEWLGITIGELDWFADRRGLESKQNQGRLRHYHYRVLAKRFGRVRLIEAPKPRLKEMQRRILTGILDHVPLHAAAHGFRRGRSIATFAACRTWASGLSCGWIWRIFFRRSRSRRVQALFRTLGYPERVADLLAGLSSNSAPDNVWSRTLHAGGGAANATCWLYAAPHLPQGAQTSPALAN